MKQIPIFLAFALAAGAALANPYVVMPNGQRVEGTAIRATATGDINLTTPQGIRTFPKGSFAKAVADEPAEYKQALAAEKAKDYAKAEKLLGDIVAKYRGLTWDVEASKALGRVLIAKGDAEKAVAAFDKLFVLSPDEKKNNETQWAYRKALLAAKQYNGLIRQLDAVAASGPRSEAARAQIMRGDIQLAQNNIELAAMDYLRTAVLFTDVKDPEIQGEACFKAAQALEQMRDPRAKELYGKVVREYAASPYAAQARGKM
jgi:TolA-binding protein